MAGVGQVLDQHFPVAIVHVAENAAGDFQPAGRRAIDHVVDGRKAFAEILLEVGPDIAHLGEHEAAVILHMPHAGNALIGLALLKTGMLVALAQWDREQRTIGLERPGVIGATEELAGVAAGVDGDARALVRAAIVEDVDLAVGVANHEHRLLADGGAEIVARVRHLAIVSDIDPGVGEQVLHLQVEDFLVDIDIAVDLGLAHQVANGGCVSVILAHAHLLSPLVARNMIYVKKFPCPKDRARAAGFWRAIRKSASSCCWRARRR